MVREDMRPVISIVITSYNYADYIGECLQSCIDQSYQNWEAIVVDDGSTDNSVGVIEEYHARDKRIKPHVLEHNHGYSYAKNYGITHSFGDYIALIDADDRLCVNSLEVRYNVFRTHPRVDMVHGLALRWYGGTDIRGYNPKTYAHAQGRMYRRNVYVRFGLYYEPLRSMSDKEFVYRIGVHPNSPLPRLINDKRIKKPVALYRKHDTQMHRVRKRNAAVQSGIVRTFKLRIKQLRRDGITYANTRFL